MSDLYPEDQHLDDELAEMTDQILNQEPSQQPPQPPLPQRPPLAQTGDLPRLQQVIEQLQQAAPGDRPSPEFSARLRAVLQKEWRHSGPRPARSIQQVIHTLGQFITANRNRSLVFAGAALALIVLLVGLLPPGAQLTGAAGTGSAPLPVEYGLGLLCLLLLAWLLFKKRD